MIYRFYREEDGAWYIDLPLLVDTGVITKGDCLMVANADVLLERLAKGNPEVYLSLETERVNEGYGKLEFQRFGVEPEVLAAVGHPEVDTGAYYYAEEFDMKIWICPTTQYVFGGYPEEIYYMVVVEL